MAISILKKTTFTPFWENEPTWRIFFSWIETTNMWSEVLHQFWVVDSLWQSGWETLVVSDVEHWKCSMYWMDPCSILCKFFSPHPTVPWYTRYHIISTCLGSNYSDGYPDRKHLLQGNVGWWNIIIIMFLAKSMHSFQAESFLDADGVSLRQTAGPNRIIYIYIYIQVIRVYFPMDWWMNRPKKQNMKCQVFEGLMAMVRISDSGWSHLQK